MVYNFPNTVEKWSDLATQLSFSFEPIILHTNFQAVFFVLCFIPYKAEKPVDLDKMYSFVF